MVKLRVDKDTSCYSIDPYNKYYFKRERR